MIRLLFIVLLVIAVIALLDPSTFFSTNFCLNQQCYHICLGGGCK